MPGAATPTEPSQARPEAERAVQRLSALAAAVRDHEDTERELAPPLAVGRCPSFRPTPIQRDEETR